MIAGPGLDLAGTAYFEDGPASDFVFAYQRRPGRAALQRLPWFLRVVEGRSGRLDVLDLLDDAVRAGERVAGVYRQRAWMHARGVGFVARYVLVEGADLDRCDPNAEWVRYVEDDLAEHPWPAFGGSVEG